MTSPLKDRPLRNPGQSVEQELQKVVIDGVFLYLIIAIMFSMAAVREWSQWYTGAPPNPILFTIFAGAAISVASWRFWRSKKVIARLRLGCDGERAVGQYLELLREKGAKVFHDIPGKGFNVDHVVVHHSGVYVIETKTLSKPKKGDAKLVFDGEKILKYGKPLGRNAVVQARAARGWIADLLKESTGRVAATKAVIVYPGWYIQATGDGKRSDVWVLNPKALPGYIDNAPTKLNQGEVSMFAFHLSRYIRTAE